MFVIGTAGHVDHGKSALVQALTGMDPDRLQEEKTRGMTIDLGFAWLRLPKGSEVSIVDVPGHERFIKNMLAGVGGIDLALLVVAADEGVMPQTREHLAILDLLGVDRGLLVVTKSDLVEPDFLDLVAADVEETVKGTTLEGSPLVHCSAVTGDGLDELQRVIEARLEQIEPKRSLGHPRLPIDRVFTIRGFGTVVTGTLIDGSFAVGDDVEIIPAVESGHLTALRSRVRGLQTHRSKVDVALPGTRTAINLTNVELSQLWRGQIVTTPGWLKPSEAVDVRLKVLDSLDRALRHNLRVTFHSLAAETPARLRLLEGDEAAPGEEAWAQLRLQRPLAPLSGDRFIIRDANETLGGGVIVETAARRHPRRRPSVLAALERVAAGDPAETLLAEIARSEPAELQALLAQTALPGDRAQAAIETLRSDGRVVLISDGESRFVVTVAGLARVVAAARSVVEAHLKQNPLRAGIAREELRSRLNLRPRPFAAVLDVLTDRGELVERGTSIATAGWEPRLSPAQRQAADAFLAELRADPYSPANDARPEAAVVGYLEESGAVVEAGGIVFANEAFQEMTTKVIDALATKGTMTMGEVRDLLGTSRRYVQPFLEELDNRGITMRRGDVRLLRQNPQATEPSSRA